MNHYKHITSLLHHSMCTRRLCICVLQGSCPLLCREKEEMYGPLINKTSIEAEAEAVTYVLVARSARRSSGEHVMRARARGRHGPCKHVPNESQPCLVPRRVDHAGSLHLSPSRHDPSTNQYTLGWDNARLLTSGPG